MDTDHSSNESLLGWIQDHSAKTVEDVLGDAVTW